MRRIIPDEKLADPTDPFERAERAYWEIGLVSIALFLVVVAGAVLFLAVLAVRALVS